MSEKNFLNGRGLSSQLKICTLYLTKKEKTLGEICQEFQFKPLAVTFLTESWKSVPAENSIKRPIDPIESLFNAYKSH